MENYDIEFVDDKVRIAMMYSEFDKLMETASKSHRAMIDRRHDVEKMPELNETVKQFKEEQLEIIDNALKVLDEFLSLKSQI